MLGAFEHRLLLGQDAVDHRLFAFQTANAGAATAALHPVVGVAVGVRVGVLVGDGGTDPVDVAVAVGAPVRVAVGSEVAVGVALLEGSKFFRTSGR